jgi:hypothetical protein
MEILMSYWNRLAGGVGAGMLVLAAAPVHAQDAPAKDTDAKADAIFRFEGKVGAEYNSNVAVLDLDTNTGQGDWALTINGLVEASGQPVDKLTLRGGYEYTLTLHEEFDAFDLALHRGFAEAAYDFDLFTAGVLGNLAQANLDGDEYLTFTQVSPYISRQFGDSLFVRLSYAATDKSFEGRPERDATSDTLAADAYFFLDGTSRYIAIGGKAIEEDANSSELDFSGGSARIRFVQRFDALDREMTFRAGAEYEQRDYDNPTVLIGAPREDKRTGVDLSLEAPVADNVFVEGSYRYGGYQSNLASADYDEHVTSVKLGVKY